MDYLPGTIIKYKELDGRKRTLYGIVCEQYRAEAVRIISETPERAITLFLGSATTKGAVSIEAILAGSQEIPDTADDGSFSPDRWHLRDLASLIERSR